MPAQLQFGDPKVARPPCGRGVILGVCRGIKGCDFDHSYHCTDAEAKNTLKLIGMVPEKLKEAANQSRKRNRG